MVREELATQTHAARPPLPGVVEQLGEPVHDGLCLPVREHQVHDTGHGHPALAQRLVREHAHVELVLHAQLALRLGALGIAHGHALQHGAAVHALAVVRTLVVRLDERQGLEPLPVHLEDVGVSHVLVTRSHNHVVALLRGVTGPSVLGPFSLFRPSNTVENRSYALLLSAIVEKRIQIVGPNLISQTVTLLRNCTEVNTYSGFIRLSTGDI